MNNFLRKTSLVLPWVLLSQLNPLSQPSFASYASSRSSASRTPVVDATSEEGQARLARSTVRADFESLAYHFEAQTNHLLSGLASATIVLNALRASTYKRAPLPAKTAETLPPGVDPFYYRYTQKTFLDSDTDNAKTLQSGFGLRKYAKALRANRLTVQLRIADPSIEDTQIRKELISNLSQAGNYVIVNYNRVALGQPDGNAIAPLGAYDTRSDSFLVLDVNPSVAPWVWVKSKDLIAAMRARDSKENHGYVLISDSLSHGMRTASR